MRESVFSEHPAMYKSGWRARPTSDVNDWGKFELASGVRINRFEG
jgi:hypothetical protein